MYDGVSPALKCAVATLFRTEMQCLAKWESMDMEFFHWIIANSNEYAMLHKDDGKGCFEEMIHFWHCFKNEHL